MSVVRARVFTISPKYGLPKRLISFKRNHKKCRRSLSPTIISLSNRCCYCVKKNGAHMWCTHVFENMWSRLDLIHQFFTWLFLHFIQFLLYWLWYLPFFVVFVFYSLLARLSIQLVGDNEKYRNSNNNRKKYKETEKKITHATSN